MEHLDFIADIGIERARDNVVEKSPLQGVGIARLPAAIDIPIHSIGIEICAPPKNDVVGILKLHEKGRINLAEVVRALGGLCPFLRLPYAGQQEAYKQGQDRDDHQKLHQSKAPWV